MLSEGGACFGVWLNRKEMHGLGDIWVTGEAGLVVEVSISSVLVSHLDDSPLPHPLCLVDPSTNIRFRGCRPLAALVQLYSFSPHGLRTSRSFRLLLSQVRPVSSRPFLGVMLG